MHACMYLLVIYNNDNSGAVKYIYFLKKYYEKILKKMRCAFVFLIFLAFTPLKGKFIVIKIFNCKLITYRGIQI